MLSGRAYRDTVVSRLRVKFQVRDGGPECFGVVLERSQADVAEVTQQSPGSTRFVIVVERESGRDLSASRVVGSTDGTTATLLHEEPVVVLQRCSVHAIPLSAIRIPAPLEPTALLGAVQA